MKPRLKKILFFTVTLLYVYSVQAIDLQSKIPKNALYVFTLNGQNVLAKMPAAELEKLSVIKYLYKSLTKDSSQAKLADLGVNIGSSSYFFVEMSDSIIYFTYLFPLSDVKKFEASFIKKNEITKDASGNKSIVKKDMTIAWNNDYAMIIGGEAISKYFTKYPGIYNNYGFPDEPENTETNYVDTVAVTVSPANIDTMVVVADTAMYKDNYGYNDDNTPPDPWLTRYDQRKQIASIWKQRKAAEIFALVPSESISANIKFSKGQDKTAEASVWMGSNQGTLYNLMSSFYRDAFNMSYKQAPTLDADLPLFSDENYLNASIYCNTNIKVDFNTTLDHRLVSDYSKMTKAKLNKKFFKYIPGENLLGYYSGAYSTKGIMEAMPHLMAPYLKMMPYTNDISSELIDLYALFIDEQAIGKLVKGDGVFAVTNIVSKEVPYTSYEYDSLYNYTEVTKTKNETFPEFVTMYSTEDPSMTDKIFTIAYKKGALVKIADNHYETPKFSALPFKISFLQKDGIVFICNTKEQVDIILNGKVAKGISKENMKSMSSNTANLFVDIKKILSLIPKKEEHQYSRTSNDLLSYTSNNVGQIRVFQSKPSGNTIHSEFMLTIPDSKENAVKYFFDFINEFYTISKKY